MRTSSHQCPMIFHCLFSWQFCFSTWNIWTSNEMKSVVLKINWNFGWKSNEMRWDHSWFKLKLLMHQESPSLWASAFFVLAVGRLALPLSWPRQSPPCWLQALSLSTHCGIDPDADRQPGLALLWMGKAAQPPSVKN